MSSNSEKAVRFPTKAQDAGDDLAKPVEELLHRLYLLGTQDEVDRATGIAATLQSPPQSVAIIEAGATAFAKWWSALAGAGVTATAIFATLNGFWYKEPESVRVAIIVGSAIVIAALVYSIGRIVSSDVSGRADGAKAIVQARAQVATQFLILSRASIKTSSPDWREALVVAATEQHKVLASVTDGTDLREVTGVRLGPDGDVQVKVGGVWVPSDIVKSFQSAEKA